MSVLRRLLGPNCPDCRQPLPVARILSYMPPGTEIQCPHCHAALRVNPDSDRLALMAGGLMVSLLAPIPWIERGYPLYAVGMGVVFIVVYLRFSKIERL